MAKVRNGLADQKLKRKNYETELRKLQVELCRLQEWVKYKGLRIVILFEGRDAAGKGGTIKAITERVSPRVFRVVALPAPSEREKTQLFIQRYIQQFPAGGEVVILDRAGTIEPALNSSWDSAPTRNTSGSSIFAPWSKNGSPTPGSF